MTNGYNNRLRTGLGLQQPTGEWTNGFSYDAAGRLTGVTSSAGTFGYHYASGIRHLVSGISLPNLSYVYDDENRLVQWFSFATDSAHATNGALRTDFYYDGLSRLRVRVEYSILAPSGGGTGPGQGAPPSGGPPPPSWGFVSETHYIYDGNRVIQERDTNNVPTVSYTRGTDLSGTLEGAGGIGGLLARSDGYSSGNWTGHTFYHADGNGNITYLETTAQTTAARYNYDPFGNTISTSGTLAAANVYRFSSKECHTNSGMYCYLYRFYDPNLQRWLNRDPLDDNAITLRWNHPEAVAYGEVIDGQNCFAFDRNDPVDQLDYDGLMPGFPSRPRPPTRPPSPPPGWPTYGGGHGGRLGTSGFCPSTDPPPCWFSTGDLLESIFGATVAGGIGGGAIFGGPGAAPGAAGGACAGAVAYPAVVIFHHIRESFK